MSQIFYFIFLLHLTVCPLWATLVEDFPTGPLSKVLEIKTVPTTIAGINAQAIEPFQGKAVHRNHYYDDRDGKAIQFLIINHTVSDFFRTMDIFTKDIPDGRVSSHYVITQPEPDKNIKGGLLYQVTPEDKTAWYINPSFWGGRKNLNAYSIGIALVNKGFVDNKEIPGEKQWFAFDAQQIDTLGILSRHLIQKYNIPPQNVLGRGDVAPYRVEGPGIIFPWEYLYTNYGVGAWLTPQERDVEYIKSHFRPSRTLPAGVDAAFFLECLKRFGYDIPEHATSITPEIQPVLRTFKAHFSYNQSPDQYNSPLDENDMLWAWGLAAKYNKLKHSKL